MIRAAACNGCRPGDLDDTIDYTETPDWDAKSRRLCPLAEEEDSHSQATRARPADSIVNCRQSVKAHKKSIRGNMTRRHCHGNRVGSQRRIG